MASKINCDEVDDCPKRTIVRTGISWGCHNVRSYAEIAYDVYCSPAGGPGKDLHPEADPEDFSKARPEPEPGVPANAETAAIVVESLPLDVPVGSIYLDCESEQTVLFIHHIPVLRCPPNYAQYVNAAESAAEDYYESFICDVLAERPCTNISRIKRREWDCRQHGFPIRLFHEVVVKLYIDLVCAKD